MRYSSYRGDDRQLTEINLFPIALCTSTYFVFDVNIKQKQYGILN